MKKSNNKRTKRLRLKYKKTKTKRNIKRRTLRKTRRRQRGGVYPSTSSVGRLILEKALLSMRQGARNVGTQLENAVAPSLHGKIGNPFTYGHHTAAEQVTPTRFITDLVEVMKSKIKAKGVKTILENCLFGEDEKVEFARTSVSSSMYKKPNAAAASLSSTLKKQNPYPININEAQFEQLKTDIGINKVDSTDEKVKEKIDKFLEDIIKDNKSQCKMRTPGKNNSMRRIVEEKDDNDDDEED